MLREKKLQYFGMDFWWSRNPELWYWLKKCTVIDIDLNMHNEVVFTTQNDTEISTHLSCMDLCKLWYMETDEKNYQKEIPQSWIVPKTSGWCRISE